MTTDLLGALRIPVVAAPMFLVSGPGLVIAAGAAGILGSFPTQNCRTAAELDQWMGRISDALNPAGARSRPWSANLITHSSNARLADDLRLIAEYRPPVVITALGSPRPALETVHGYGGLVLADVVDLRLARKAAECGVDGLACIAAGAGGHTGHLSPFAFVSAVREFFDGLVIVGGGIGDGHGVAGAVAAGADLVYLGTRFLATAESMAPAEYKTMVVDHGADDLVVSAGITGTPASWLRPSLLASGLDPDRLDPAAVSRNYSAGGDAIKRWKDLWAAGQGLTTIRSVESVENVVEQLAGEYHSALDRVVGLRGRAVPVR
ncbi:nitronate monooxygenase [Nocardia puris]|uniref:Nitronate monooxygenase n=1 Tax=Nocardia puris TaxID=208602 RepID=A0A366E2N7_9NOCA|nr:nitronate monooxygenase [Nocardia puris]MBF6212601.1 nitronate monooxygenase [Nocardia puris]MBF6369181.1 nitronate monooxygenase [Nocardia puris]MBF6461190.1 nitronate monooxygenase [Nocardia puris]RBO96582.1 nitronate monooxygenase [Nocardia puris]